VWARDRFSVMWSARGAENCARSGSAADEAGRVAGSKASARTVDRGVNLARAVLLLLVFVLLVDPVAPEPAHAIEVQEGVQRQAIFAGPGCGSMQVERVVVPSGVRRVRSRPNQGLVLNDATTGAPVARLSSRLVAVGSKRVVEFTAVGTDDTCARPAVYAASGWRTGPTAFSVGWLARRRAFFRSFNDDAITRPRYKPRLVRFGRHGLMRVGAWTRWNGPRATGRGLLSVGFSGRRAVSARISLSEPMGCNFQIRYSLMRVRVTGRLPAGVKRRYSERFGC
jgi:hypothetical protein